VTLFKAAPFLESSISTILMDKLPLIKKPQKSFYPLAQGLTKHPLPSKKDHPRGAVF
jgi:hypothetical protein